MTNKFKLALELHYYLNLNFKKTVEKAYNELHFDNEMTLSQFRLFYRRVKLYEYQSVSYCREIQIFFYLNRKCFEGYYVKVEDLLNFIEWEGEPPSGRTIRRYMKDINDAGYIIETKKGRDGGYKLAKFHKGPIK